MSPRPGDREGSSLHVVEEVKARIGVEGSGRNNLLLSMLAAIVVAGEAVAREGKPRTSSKLRLVVFLPATVRKGVNDIRFGWIV